MFKLTVISGPNRGSSFAIRDGENGIGRQSGNVVVLPSSRVSKRHCVLIVNNDEAIVRDEGSSNGTFVNGLLVQIKKVQAGDRISVGEFVMELSEPKQGARAHALPELGHNVLQFPAPAGAQPGLPATGAPGLDAGLPEGNQIPTDLKGKALWYVDRYAMPFFYGLNLKNEWRLICVGIFVVFAAANLVISVSPLLESGRQMVLREAARRADFMAREIAERNAPFLAQRMETKTEIGAVENADGVRVAVLTDLESRIIAPAARLNQYLTSGPEALYAVKARDLFRSGRESGITAAADSSTIVAIEPVKILSTQAGKNVTVGMAIVSIDTSTSTPGAGETGMIYAETLILTAIIGGLALFVLYRLTLKPFQVLSDDMDRALKGELGEVTHEFKLQELNPLWDLINSAIQRIPKGGAPGGTGLSAGGAGDGLVEEILTAARMLGDVAGFGIALCDAEKKISYLNPVFEEVTGIRGDGSIGQEFPAVARDEAFSALMSDLIDRALPGLEPLSEEFDFSGVSHRIHIAALGSAAGGARGYLIVAARNEEHG